jgi:hypothetical protein
MAVPPPPAKKRAGKGAPPKAGEPTGAVGTPTEKDPHDKQVTLNMLVDKSFRDDVKVTAAMTGQSVKSIMLEGFALWKQSKGL